MHALSDFDESWCVELLWGPEGVVIKIKTGIGSRNELSAVAILNFLFSEFLGGAL